MSSIALGMPAKVRKSAAVRGMHMDCMAAEPDGVCSSCIGVLNDAMDEHYGHHAKLADALANVAGDLLDDLLAGA